MGKYDDIIHLPHHQSLTHPHMSLNDRAAQFSPFAALSGYDDMVREAGRLTEDAPELTEDDREILDRRLALIAGALSEGRQPSVSITCFVPDAYKKGGSFITVKGTALKIDFAKKNLLLNAQNDTGERQIIAIETICDISGEFPDEPA